MKFKVKKRRLEAGDELGVDWERFADGCAWRLKRKRDFADVDPTLAMEAAANAAERMGKAVQAVRDRHFPDRYIWVQFVDGRIRTGEPCACGSRRLLRVHPHFLRCPACGSTLLETSAEEEYESRSAYRLRKLDDVHLMRLERSGDRDIYRGYAERDGQPVVVFAEFEVRGGEPLSREIAYERVVKVETLPFDGLSDLFDLSALRSGARDWDLVL